MKKHFKAYPQGSAQYVIAHAAWRRSRGRHQPSMTYLTERNPRKALVAAQQIRTVHQQIGAMDPLCASVGIVISRRKNVREMNQDELKVVIRGIVTTSTSEQEIRQRLKDEIGCSDEGIMLIVDAPGDDVTDREAVDLVKALGGLVTKNGLLVQCEVDSFPWTDDEWDFLLDSDPHDEGPDVESVAT